MDEDYFMCYVLPTVIIIIIIGLVTFGMVSIVRLAEAKQSSCEKIGMEYFYSDGTRFCIDKNNKAHYVKIECDTLGFLKYSCIPRIISIGEIMDYESYYDGVLKCKPFKESYDGIKVEINNNGINSIAQKGDTNE